MSFQNLRAVARRIKRDGVTLWFACRDARTPSWIKALAGLVVAYALSPVDLVPDFIPVLGHLDDAILLPGLIWLVVRLVPADVLEDCRRRAQVWMAQQRQPVSRWGLLLVVGLWTCVAWGVWCWLTPKLS